MRCDKVTRELDRQPPTFLTGGDDAGDDDLGPAGVPVNLTDAKIAEGALNDLVPSRTFLKLSSTRQHMENLRDIEAEERKKRVLEGAADSGDGNANEKLAARAARKKAQDEALKRLSQRLNNGQPPPLSKTKDSAIERSMMLLKQVPQLL